MSTTAAAAAPPPRPALRRRTEQRLGAGVAGGVADWLNAPVGWVRVVFFLALSWEPWLWAAYVVAALVVPARGRSRPDWDNLIGLGRLAVPFAVSVVLGSDFPLNYYFEKESPAIWVPLLGLTLAGAAVFLTSDYRRTKPRSPAETRATVLGALPPALIALVVAVGLLAAPEVRWDRLLPLGVIAMGATLMGAARSSSWRAVVAPALFAAALVTALVAADARLQGGIGDVYEAPASRGELPPIRRAFGDVDVNLTRLGRRPVPITLRASAGVGDVHVVIPKYAELLVEAHVGRGEIQTIPLNGGGRWEEGVDLDVVHRWTPRGSLDDSKVPAPTIHVIAEAGLGNVHIHRAGVETTDEQL